MRLYACALVRLCVFVPLYYCALCLRLCACALVRMCACALERLCVFALVRLCVCAVCACTHVRLCDRAPMRLCAVGLPLRHPLTDQDLVRGGVAWVVSASLSVEHCQRGRSCSIGSCGRSLFHPAGFPCAGTPCTVRGRATSVPLMPMYLAFLVSCGIYDLNSRSLIRARPGRGGGAPIPKICQCSKRWS